MQEQEPEKECVEPSPMMRTVRLSAMKDACDFVTRAFEDHVQALAGTNASDYIKHAGLRKVHEVMHIDELPVLRSRVHKSVKQRVLQLIAYVAEELGFRNEIWLS